VRQLHEGVPDNGGVVLPVDHRDGSHERDVTSTRSCPCTSRTRTCPLRTE
jgi:hypothetical protein